MAKRRSSSRVSLSHTIYSDVEGDALAAKWACVRRYAETMFRVVERLSPGYRQKCLRYLKDVIFLWDEPEALERALGRYIELMPRLCARPFSTEAGGCSAISSLSRLDDAHWNCVVGAGDAAFKRLEKACRRTNDEWLIANGLWSMALAMPAPTAAGFVSSPGVLLDAAKTLGSTRAGSRETLLRELEQSDLFRVDPERLRTRELVETLQHIVIPAASTVVSRRLKEHLDGRREMSAAQVERARARIVDAWSSVLLSRVEQSAVERLAGDVGAAHTTLAGKERHALLFQVSAAEHRRALKKLLKAHFSGDGDYLTNHPLNEGWFAEHPRIDRGVWTQGLELRTETSDHGDITVRLEPDPLEVLRMGTYVGTCLGLGGGQAYTAVAVMLDANKQVAYCRDARGRVLGRQLLALSESERLCCFEIYPLDGTDSIQNAFMDFDRAMAEALGTPLYDPETEDEEDDIKLLLSRDWWFDELIRVPSG